MENTECKRKSIKLSASLISDYLQCPMKAYYRLYHPELSVQTEALVLGNTVHRALEKHWDNFLDATRFINSTTATEKIKTQALEMVSNFFRYFRDFVGSGDSIEEFISFNYHNIPFVAKIDRIHDNTIIDWKTSRKSKEHGVETDIQSIIYKRAYQSKYNKLPYSILFVNLRNNDAVNASVDSEFENYFWEEVVPFVYEQITNCKFKALGWFQYYQPCKFCQYKEACMNHVRNYTKST